MKNALQTSTRIKELANYLADNSDKLSKRGPEFEWDERRARLRELRDELEHLAVEARTNIVTYFQFQNVMEKFTNLGAKPPKDAVSDLEHYLFDK